MRTAQDGSRRFANLVELPERDDFLVRGDLEDAVGGSVDDGRAGAHVLGSQFFDDLGAGRGFIAQRAPADPVLEVVHNFRRETARVEWKRFFQMDAGHLPVTGGGVFAGRGQRATAEGGGWIWNGCKACKRLDVGEAEPAQV